jgi:V/A-type H+/Na+-transporting ATPase subunit D
VAERSASRAALLALRRDRRVIEEGHRFLDERRVALAHELLRRAQAQAEHRAAFLQAHARARAAFGDAVGRHGFEGLQAYPPAVVSAAAARHEDTPFLGVHLVDAARLDWAVAEDAAAVLRSSEAGRCARAFGDLARDAAALAGEVASLLRLMAEYRRTERRVRAIENIVLPEARADERRFEAALEEVDQEEVMRSRLFAVEDLGASR